MGVGARVDALGVALAGTVGGCVFGHFASSFSEVLDDHRIPARTTLTADATRPMTQA